MKKTVLFFALAFVCALAQLFAQSGTIRELIGEVSLKQAGASSFRQAAIGDAVAKDTVVSTGFRSTALIAAGSSLIAVRPLTRLSLSEIQQAAGTETLNINLQAGRVKVDVKPPAGTRANFTVQSPSATASVRGTSFEFDSVNLLVTEGVVDFQGSNGMMMPVSAGDSSSVGAEGKAADPVSTTTDSLLPPPPVGAVDSGIAPPPAGGQSSGADLSISVTYATE